MSYADVAGSGPKQSPEEPPQVIPHETASTASLVDVDMPSVHTVPADFLDQEIQTETQQSRLDREAAAAKAKAEKAKKEAKAKAKRADNWLVNQFSQLSDGSAGALAIANVVGVIGLSSYLGYKGWGLYERGRLSWETVGLGVGIMAGVGAAEAVLGSYLARGQKKN
ncbi:hypothetical protein CC79DRAFT_157178 [Sarocladium strictum]